MPNLVTTIEHLADLELYKTEKPYCILASSEDIPDGVPSNNLVFKRHNALVRDIRGYEDEYALDKSGFTSLNHTTRVTDFQSLEGLKQYQEETQEFLERYFDADCVVTWDIKLRDNTERTSFILDLGDWTKPDRPAQGAHNDVTYESGPNMIEDHLPEDIRGKYSHPEYRFRIVNTWRPLLPKIEDSPLALCDFRSIDKDDLVACDRVIPTRAGEVYYLKHNPQQRWHWLEHMTPSEMFLFIMWDSAEGPQARYCPHAPIDNPRAPLSAAKRKSVETRNIIISEVA